MRRYVIWINRGTTPTIERASLEGSDRHTLHSTGLIQPSGITMDYSAQKIYWTDGSSGIIESSYYDGSRRQRLITLAGVAPFAITLERRVVYWTESGSSVVFATNKVAVNDNRTVVQVYGGSNTISSIISLSPHRQNNGTCSTVTVLVITVWNCSDITRWPTIIKSACCSSPIIMCT